MATVGNSTTPTFGWNSSGLNTDNQVASQYTMPSSGIITSVSAYFGGNGAAVNAKLVIWDGSTGSVLWSSSTFSAASGTQTAGGQAWNTQTVSGGLFVASGASIWIGFYRDPAGSDVFSVASSGGAHWMSNTGASPSAFTGSVAVSTNGTMGSYGTYTPTGAKVNTGTSGSPVWTSCQPQINTGTSGSPVWTAATLVQVNTGTSGTPVWTPSS